MRLPLLVIAISLFPALSVSAEQTYRHASEPIGTVREVYDGLKDKLASLTPQAARICGSVEKQ